MVAEGGVMKDGEIENRDIIKTTDEMDEGQHVPYGSFVLGS